MASSIFSRPVDFVLFMFLLSHIPITILLDSQSIIPRELYPDFAKRLLDFWIDTSQDPLVSTNPTWFKALVWCELCIQLPYFFLATYALLFNCRYSEGRLLKELC